VEGKNSTIKSEEGDKSPTDGRLSSQDGKSMRNREIPVTNNDDILQGSVITGDHILQSYGMDKLPLYPPCV